ncbi:MAG: hypothetical protein ACI97A_002885 [Planctomycetota bacterium]|jgi:hypothetical protein
MKMTRSFFLCIAFLGAISMPVVAVAQDKLPQKDKLNSKRSESPADLKTKITRLEQQIQIANLELQASEISVMIKDSKSKETMRNAAFTLQMAKQSLETFTVMEAPVQIRDAQVSFDQARNRAELAKDELNELIAMYKAEEFAELTKELVLKRGKKNVEFSNRRLAIQAEKMTRLKQKELPKKQKELEHKVRQAEVSMRSAELEAKKASIDIQIMSMKAKNKISGLISDLEGAKSKLSKATANSQ